MCQFPIVVQLLILGDPGHCSWPGSFVHEVLQARILERVAIPFSRESSQSRNQTQVSYIAGGFFNSLLSEPPRSLSMPISINLYLLLSVVVF